MNVHLQRHAGGVLQEKRLVLDAVGPEHEIGETLVRDDLLSGVVGLRHVDGGGRVFGS